MTFGSHVDKVGDEVFGMALVLHAGAWAEYIAVDEDCVSPKPTNIPFEQAASLPLAGLTAYHSLVHAGYRVRPGSRVLIIGEGILHSVTSAYCTLHIALCRLCILNSVASA
jgi:NADPH:quinone reductase-like Zn-dependent oxidoreductase